MEIYGKKADFIYLSTKNLTIASEANLPNSKNVKPIGLLVFVKNGQNEHLAIQVNTNLLPTILVHR
jgi:hypothetical protein